MRSFKGNLGAFAAGALFAVGLAIGGMTLPSKVKGFLDFAGDWDPSLMFVMGGAVMVYFVAHRLVLKRKAPLFESKFHLPTRRDLDVRLILGAAIFGVGWGMAGYCPGPGLASLGAGSVGPLAFVTAMGVGMIAQRKLDAMLAKQSASAASPPVPPLTEATRQS